MAYLLCPLKYIGQAGNELNARYKDYIHAMRSSNGQFWIFRPHDKHNAYIWKNNTYYECHEESKGRHLNNLEKILN
jgi:hypothetical protein